MAGRCGKRIGHGKGITQIFSGENFDPEDEEKHAPEYISREALMDIGLPMANIMQDVREKWIAQWDEV